ncbi:fluoride efflux transporter CrcB [Streptomyces lushanensis]|uniref:fluoride efflux transporter CrcB n=1 Tax=Streptomyces lushanensis TaxID=1434255 RepID=UPI00099F5EC1|nr:fluoride efflux transporter CrcB [Streptomyces lushanensis]
MVVRVPRSRAKEEPAGRSGRPGVDPDVDLSVPGRRPARPRVPWSVVAVVALGAMCGSAARYGASLLWPTAADGFPWTTFTVNVTGCALIGVFMVVVTEAWAAHRLIRPFVGTGVLGGFTTFSTYAVDIERLVDAGRARTGMAYLGLTLLAALAAVWAAVWVTRRVVAWRQA